MKQIIDRDISAGRTALTEPKAKRLCGEYSIPVPISEVVGTENEAVEASRKLGFPLVAKVVSPQIPHKTEVGGVVLGIRSVDEVRAAFRKILTHVGENKPRATVDGILLERMEAPGIEVIVGATHDPQFGKVLMFGLGGIFVEVLRDVVFRLAPITRAQAREMVHGIRSSRLLTGYRGHPRVDEDAVTGILMSVSKLVSENQDVLELDLNPIIVHESGATVVDARGMLSTSRPKKQVEGYPTS